MSNPKQAFGAKKPPLAQVPLVALAHASMAFLDGSLKYGYRNWRENPVEAMTYVEAIKRHVMLWAEGEENARDTNVHNLGGVIASAALLLDAQANGTLIDNRSKSQAACDLLHELEGQVTHLKLLQTARDDAKADAEDEAQVLGAKRRQQAMDAINLLEELNSQWWNGTGDQQASLNPRMTACRDLIANMALGVFPALPEEDDGDHSRDDRVL
jgi:hypothetical protein